MKICPNCGIKAESKFCPECGYDLSIISEETTEVRENISNNEIVQESSHSNDDSNLINKSENTEESNNESIEENNLQNNDSIADETKRKVVLESKKKKTSKFKKILLIVTGIIVGLFILIMAMPCPHEWVEATCTESKYCDICGEIEGEPLGHTKGEWTLTEEATLVDVGVEEILCTICGESLDSRGTERKNAKVTGFSFNFEDEELIDWINEMSSAEVEYEDLDLFGSSSTNTSYRITLKEGDKGALILNHDTDDKVKAIMVYFEEYTQAAAFAAYIGEKIDSDFDAVDAMFPLVDDESYTAANMTVVRLNLDTDFEVTVLAPTAFIEDIVG